jgi:hypothetical protein
MYFFSRETVCLINGAGKDIYMLGKDRKRKGLWKFGSYRALFFIDA